MEWRANPKLILVDRNVAFVACLYEMLDMLQWLFCLCFRTLVFFSVSTLLIPSRSATTSSPKRSLGKGLTRPQ